MVATVYFKFTQTLEIVSIKKESPEKLLYALLIRDF